MEPRPTRRFLKKMEMNYIHCPECESQSIIRNGKSDTGTQKYLCKVCHFQFVMQYGAIFPASKRRWIFEDEFTTNLKPTGFKRGCGRKTYWEGARLGTLQMLESHKMKVWIDRLLKNFPIQGEREYRGLIEILLNEAYRRAAE